MGILTARFRLFLWRCALLALAPWMLLGESRPIASEQELKAAALYQVLHFTRWPPERMGAPDSPLVVGVFGENRFAPLLQELVKQEKVSGHPVIITRCFTVESAAACHAVFVSGAEDRTTERLLAHMQGRGVLTVGDNELFAERGGSVCLTVRDDRIRVLVNLGAARRDGIVLSSKLLRLAEIVEK